MVPSIFVHHRSKYAKPRTGLSIDEPLTNWLRSAVEGIDQYPPEVVLASKPRKIGASFVSHTDGTERKLVISQDAREIFKEDELRAAVMKGYCEMKSNASEKFVYVVNLTIMLYFDAIILLSAASNSISTESLKLALVIALAVVVLGFIFYFRFFIRLLHKRKEFDSDSTAAAILKDSTALESFIAKAANHYIMSPMATPRRQMKIMAYQQKMANMRIAHLENRKYSKAA